MKVKIPKHWTPEQANAVAEFLGDIEIVIRKKYQVRIMAHQLSELCSEEQLDDEKKKREGHNF